MKTLHQLHDILVLKSDDQTNMADYYLAANLSLETVTKTVLLPTVINTWRGTLFVMLLETIHGLVYAPANFVDMV